MKTLLIAPCILLLQLFSSSRYKNVDLIDIKKIDSIPGQHVTDGLVDEWPLDAFHADNDTTVFTAIDNDNNNLYVAITIPEFSMQTKLMRNGMKLFIDLKTKKKTTHGVEFPIGEEVTNFLRSSFPETNSPGMGQQNKKLLRQTMSLGMIAMKIFGLTAAGKEQGLKVNGSINIAFKWDANDEMHIEYNIPFKLLDIQAGDKKEMDIGWTINGMQHQQNTNEENTDNSEGNNYRRSGGGSYGSGRRSGTGFSGGQGRSGRRMTTTEMMKEQSYWTKYTLSDNKKPF